MSDHPKYGTMTTKNTTNDNLNVKSKGNSTPISDHIDVDSELNGFRRATFHFGALHNHEITGTSGAMWLRKFIDTSEFKRELEAHTKSQVTKALENVEARLPSCGELSQEEAMNQVKTAIKEEKKRYE